MKYGIVLWCAVIIAVSHAALGAPTAQATELDCLIEPYMVVTLGTPVEGLVERVTVDRGDFVEKGEVLATLESSLEKVAVAIARARTEMDATIKANRTRVSYGDRRVDRIDELFRQEVLSFGELDEAETSKLLAEMGLLEAVEKKRLAELELQRATAALRMRTIRSPITGVVVERLLHPGEFANQAPVLKIAQIDPLRVEVFAPVSLLGKVAVGMETQVVPEAPANGVHVARVTVVDRVVDAASGTFGVRLEMPNPDYSLPAGLKCKVHFPTD